MRNSRGNSWEPEFPSVSAAGLACKLSFQSEYFWKMVVVVGLSGLSTSRPVGAGKRGNGREDAGGKGWKGEKGNFIENYEYFGEKGDGGHPS